MKKSIMAGALALAFTAAALADDRIARFEGGIGVIPVSSAAGTQNANGTFPDVNRNDVRGIAPGGQPWVISRLSADVRSDGSISVDGRGLLLAGGNTIGTNGGQMVKAMLFCDSASGSSAPSTGLVALDPAGDFRIEDRLTPVPPEPCASPVLLIVNSGNRWFAAGIPKQ